MDRRRGAAYEPAFYSDVIARLAVNPSIRLRSADANPTLLREAEQHVCSKYVDQVLDSLYVLESSMGHFFIRAEMGKNAGRKQSEVDADYEKAAHLAAWVAPYRHARLSAMKLAGDPNNPVRIKDDATADEIRTELMKHLGILIDGGLIDLEALPAPNRGIANQPNTRRRLSIASR
jgi:hypothetical protein